MAGDQGLNAGLALPVAGPPDDALMALVRDGDAMALHQLMNRHWKPAMRYALGILGDADAAADAAQQTFIRLWQRRDRWKPTASVEAYILRITRNVALNECRARRARARCGESLRCECTSSPSTPFETLEEKELRAALDAALGRLSACRKRVFTLARVQELSYHEISALMGISPQTVANQMSAAMADLRRHLRPVLDAR